MASRVASVVCVCAVLPALASLVVYRREALSTQQQAVHGRLENLSRASGTALGARLSAAESIARSLAAQSLSAGELQREARASRAFSEVYVSGRPPSLGALSAHEQRALEEGGSIVVVGQAGAWVQPVWLARELDAAPSHVAFFELASDWLWPELRSLPPGVQLMLIDGQGRPLQTPIALPADVLAMFARHIDPTIVSGEGTELAWQSAGQGWEGVLSRVLTRDAQLASPWAVVAFTREPDITLSIPSLREALLPVLLALAAALMGALYLRRRYVPALLAVREGLQQLQERRFEPLTERGADEPQLLVQVLNRCASNLQEQLRALETLAEIDRLLLGSAGLEQVLDAILRRVQRLTHCHGVGIALRDPDAPGHGRVYLAAADVHDLPVSRVLLDEGMLATLAAETNGLTIARCEDTRHSFLKPLKDAGAEIFWVWPVMVAERIEAMLAVGYREIPSADPQVLRCGGEFAARLGIALSKRAREDQLYRQAHYDALTALPNRLLFRDRLSQELSSAVAGAVRGALLYIDLDHFKKVNDTVGHGAGDQLLTIVAHRLRSCVKEGDTVARLGGDEFAIVLRHVADSASARTVAERVIASLQLPVSLSGRDHHVCASIGITFFPEEGTGIEELLRNADTAMYRAKELGRGRAMCFDRSMSPQLEKASDSGLQRALRRREFSLYYQPQFSVADGALIGAEALLRWQSPRDGLRQPGEFVPAAEESGLIVDIGGWVLEAACAQLALWRDQGVSPLRLSLNIAERQLRDEQFAGLVRRALDRFALPGELLEFEVAESAFADEAAAASLARLAQTGVRLALDDFGLGYSSLSCLRQHPIGVVKIDRSFLAEVPQNPTAATLVETIIVMAHALGKRVVAEGIETLEQLDFLRERRCDAAQGFYLARPLAASAMTELLTGRAAGAAGASAEREAG